MEIGVCGIERVNLDSIIDDFGYWKDRVESLEKTNSLLNEKLQASKNAVSRAEAKEKHVKTELQKTTSLLSTAQGTLFKRCNKDGENEKLKAELKSIKLEILKQEKDHQVEKAAIKKNTDYLIANHIEEMQDVKDSLLCKASEEESILRSELDARDTTISRLNVQLKVAEKEKQAETVRLRIEYDGKISKLQSQLAKAQQSNTASAHQDIFRKKLQHYKEESDREVSDLKAMIQDLQHQLEVAYQAAPVPTPAAMSSYPEPPGWPSPQNQPQDQPGFNKKVMTSAQRPEQQQGVRSLSLSGGRGRGRPGTAGARGGKQGAAGKQQSPRTSAANPLTFTNNTAYNKRQRQF